MFANKGQAGAARPRRPLAFVQPCPMGVTPLVYYNFHIFTCVTVYVYADNMFYIQYVSVYSSMIFIQNLILYLHISLAGQQRCSTWYLYFYLYLYLNIQYLSPCGHFWTFVKAKTEQVWSCGWSVPVPLQSFALLFVLFNGRVPACLQLANNVS